MIIGTRESGFSLGHPIMHVVHAALFPTISHIGRLNPLSLSGRSSNALKLTEHFGSPTPLLEVLRKLHSSAWKNPLDLTGFRHVPGDKVYIRKTYSQILRDCV